ADMADRIAVSSHDLEDGMRARLIGEEQLMEVEIFAEAERRINAGEIKDRTIRRTRTAKTIIDRLVGDCIEASWTALAQANVKTAEQVCARKENLIVLSGESEAGLLELEKFLLENFYQHELLLKAAASAKQWLERLFERLCQQPELMPGYFRRLAEEEGLHRTVCDYIAGMTDRFCLKLLGNKLK
ncbi:MAG: hypothetical protein ACYSR4_02535, partial [Planctomycetota bacterium]